MEVHGRSRLIGWTAEALRLGSRQAERLAIKLKDQPDAERATTAARRIDDDPLTMCVARDTFSRALQDALDATSLTRGSVGVIAVDIDQFTALMASHGATAGNQVLAAAAERLRQAVRPSDLVTRIGGDGFAMLWRTTENAVEAGAGRRTIVDVANRLTRRFDLPIQTSAGELRVAVNVGTAAVSHHEAATTDSETLLQQASTAVNSAKNLSRDQIVSFDLSMQQRAVEKYRTENDLRTALHNDAVDVHYQPIVNLRTGAVVGVEALARWEHEAIGTISPGLFIPVAEESGLINELGAQVMATTVRQGAAWNRHPATDTLVTLNLSGRQLLDQKLVHNVASLLEEHSLDPTRLCLEITESVVMHDVATSMTILGMLKDLGLCLAIDDFGTGYSSLSYLRRLPVDILKIDRSFVHSIHNRDDRMIIKAIIELAHALGMTTIAEGIETRMQIEVLHALNCDMAQGFLLHRPTPADEVDMNPIDFSSQPHALPPSAQTDQIFDGDLTFI